MPTNRSRTTHRITSREGANIPEPDVCDVRCLLSGKGSEAGAKNANRSAGLHAEGLMLLSHFGGNPAIRDVCSDVRGLEALRHRLSTVLPLFDAQKFDDDAR
jgi:hypothetical protein